MKEEVQKNYIFICTYNTRRNIAAKLSNPNSTLCEKIQNSKISPDNEISTLLFIDLDVEFC